MADKQTERNFVDDRHALYAGWVMGLAMKNGLDVKPVADDAGNFTDRLEVELQPGPTVPAVTITLVVPPPPDDWQLTDE